MKTKLKWMSLGALSLSGIVVIGLFFVYSRLIGFGFNHAPMSTASTLMHLMLEGHAYEKVHAYPERYLFKKNQKTRLLEALSLKERTDLQMGALIYFENPQGMRCATYLNLNPWYGIYDFEQGKCV
jgi:hypothetical protein